MKRFVILSALPLLLNLIPTHTLRADTVDATAYVRKIIINIERQKFFPRHAPAGKTVVAFALDRNGNLVSERIAKTSGSDTLDAAALRIVRRAFPCKPPADFAGGRFTLPLNFHSEASLNLKRIRPPQ